MDSIMEELPRLPPQKGYFSSDVECRAVAINVSAPESHPSTSCRFWRVDQSFSPQERQRGCFSPLWVAFSILIGGLMLDEPGYENKSLKFHGNWDIADESCTKPRQRVKLAGEHHSSSQKGPPVHLKVAPALLCSSSPLIHVFIVSIITILFALILGIWR